MRRIALLFLCVLLACAPALAAETDSASASGGGVVTSYTMNAVLGADGTAQVNSIVTLRITESTPTLVIPLGANASNCVVNGVRLSVRKQNGMPCVTLRSDAGLIGDLQVNLSYQLNKCVSPEGILELPILAGGYVYPIENLSFEITLPGEGEVKPTFSSGYLGEDADNYLDLTIESTVIRGTFLKPMRDHDSMTMRMETPETMFTRQAGAGTTLRVVSIAVAVLAALMILYWAVTLSWRPVRVGYQSYPPLGETAGETGALLTGDHLRFSLMVVTWAQMGYLTIQKGRDVVLYRRMDMGNERSELEIRAFNRLFRKRRSVSATGGEFRRLREQVDSQRPRVGGQFAASSGNPVILRVLGVLLGLFAGIGIGDGGLPVMAARFLPVALFALASAWGSWKLQAGVHAALRRDKSGVAKGAAVLLGYITVGALCGQVALALVCVLIQLLAGLATLFGGRRTEDGRRTVQGELGMIRFFCREYKERHQTAQHQNPSYYYDLAPYALALGVDKAFARRFERMELPPCSWLRCQVNGRTAEAWRPVLRETVDIMEGRPTGLERTFLGRVIVAFYIARRKSTRSRSGTAQSRQTARRPAPQRR